jgi:hypothetical protein
MFPPKGAVAPPVAPRGNGAATASLIFGVLGCVPELTGLLAIILGIIGLRRARKLNARGKGLAAAGLTLGIVSVIVWTIGLIVAGVMWRDSGPARDAARLYLADFSRHDVTAILHASTHSVTQAQVEALDDRLRPLGNLQDVSFKGVYLGYANGRLQCRMNGVAHYSNGDAQFTITVVQIDDVWKVNEFWINGHLTNMPRPPDNVQI